ncbi:DciA family protein [Streptomyces eurythermus]
MSQQPSGIDLARAALASARAAAKTRPTQPQQKRRTGPTSSSRRRLGDPMGLGAAITGMMTDRGWEPPEQGSILDQWPSIAPELAAKVTAVRYEHDTGVLHLRPVSPSYATQLRLHQAGILAKVQQAPVGRTVKDLKILPPGAATEPQTGLAEQHTPAATPAPQAPMHTRETASPGYRNPLAAVFEHRPTQPAVDLYLERAMRRQEAALRANRAPDTPLELAPARQPDRSDAVRRAALARKRQDTAGTGAPQRAFDVA